MRYCLVIVLLTLTYCMLGSCDKPDQADEFAEFDADDDFVEVHEETIETNKQARQNNKHHVELDADDDGIVEDDDDKSDFEHFDAEEFEGLS